ncbi:hypothetical protein M569_10066, partial [Genlisea aurea]
PESFVVQIPRDQILRYPPPENARKYEALRRRGERGNCCCRCCCFLICFLLFLILAVGIAALVLYLVFRFKAPNYAVTNVAISGLVVTSSGPISPVFDVTIRANNPNSKVGIYYLEGSSVDVLFNGVSLSSGVLPAFYQPSRNVTIVQTALVGSGVVLGSTATTALVNDQSQGFIPFEVKTRAPVKIRIGSVNTWKITVKVRCDVVVNSLTSPAVVSNSCHYNVRLW